MASTKCIIIGLGNPGIEYEGTRHNVGFEVIEAIGEKIGETFKTKAQSRIAWGKWKGRPLGLAMPQTFMNRSGLAVEELLRKNQLDTFNILVIVDDINLPPGKIRIREKGGTGGHNGLDDIIDWLDSDAFPRLRIGIGNDFKRGGQASYVLEPFSYNERKLIVPAIQSARDAALSFVTNGITITMNRFNT